jgi:hypothetical protein
LQFAAAAQVASRHIYAHLVQTPNRELVLAFSGRQNSPAAVAVVTQPLPCVKPEARP